MLNWHEVTFVKNRTWAGSMDVVAHHYTVTARVGEWSATSVQELGTNPFDDAVWTRLKRDAFEKLKVVLKQDSGDARYCSSDGVDYYQAVAAAFGKRHVDHLCVNTRCVNPQHLVPRNVEMPAPKDFSLKTLASMAKDTFIGNVSGSKVPDAQPLPNYERIEAEAMLLDAASELSEHCREVLMQHGDCTAQPFVEFLEAWKETR